MGLPTIFVVLVVSISTVFLLRYVNSIVPQPYMVRFFGGFFFARDVVADFFLVSVPLLRAQSTC
jgi:hypothetical protein